MFDGPADASYPIQRFNIGDAPLVLILTNFVSISTTTNHARRTTLTN